MCPFLRVRKTSDDDPLQPSTPIKTFLGHLIGWSCIPCPFLNPSLQGNAAHFPHTPQACSPEHTKEVHRAFAHAFPLELESFPDFSILSFFSRSVKSDSCDSMDPFFHLEKLYSKATPQNPLPPAGWGGSPLGSHSLLGRTLCDLFLQPQSGAGPVLVQLYTPRAQHRDAPRVDGNSCRG